MTILGHIQNGVVVVDQPLPLPDGTPVRVEVLDHARTEGADDAVPTLADRLANVIGIGIDLPADLAEQHDHYLHGLPKK